MRSSDLPSPGLIANGVALKREVLRALNTVQVLNIRAGQAGASETGKALARFLVEAAKAAVATRTHTAPADAAPSEAPE